ncbi:MAG: glycosyltransferase [Acidobacteriota bacterium]
MAVAEPKAASLRDLSGAAQLEILFLTQTYPRFPEDVNGPFIRDLAQGLVRGGDRVTVLTPHAAGVPQGWDDEGVKVESFRYAPVRAEVLGYGRSLQADETVKLGAKVAAPFYALGARRALSRALRAKRWDLVHAHWIVPNGVVASGVAGRVPLAIGLHGSDVFMAEKKAFRPLARRALARAGLLTGCSPELVDRVRALGFPAAASRVIPYGVDIATFRPSKAVDSESGSRVRWRHKLAIPLAAPMALSVGRMATKKGFQVLLEGLDELFARAPDSHLVLAGGGDRLEEFKARAEPWRQRVHFPGAVLRDELPSLFRAADAFVLPAVHDRKGNVDGLPNVILEAMASGLAVVASEISGIPLAVVEGETGHLVPEGKVEPLVQTLGDLLASPERRRLLGRNGRRRAEADLTWDAVAARYRRAYAWLLAGGQRNDDDVPGPSSAL